MDTEHASPQFKVGDRVKVNALHLKNWHGMTGTVVEHSTAFLYPYRVEFATTEIAAFNDDDLAPTAPLGVEYWRLLFRAHRDGWRLINDYCYRQGGIRVRQYCHEGTGLVSNIETWGGAR